MYEYLLQAVAAAYEPLQIMKENDRGSVTLLRHKTTGKQFVFREFEGNAQVYRRLLAVNCANLPRIEEVAERDGRVAVLEEYIAGDTLADLLEGALCTPREAKEILVQLCRALWVLHRLGAVHRDVKPENVILRGREAVLIDFDASRVYKDDHETDTQVLGTTGYAPPEQYGLSQTDGRADIYALGVLLNIMLTGKHPSRALAEGRMGRIVQKCTMMNPEKRYKTVLHLMEAL